MNSEADIKKSPTKKVTIEFDLEDSEAREELDLMLKARDLANALFTFDQESLRRRVKYDSSISDKERELADKLRDELREVLDDKSIIDLVL